MDFISEEFLAARTGEALEARLRDSDTFRQQMKSLHEASKAFSKDSGMSKKCWKLYDAVKKLNMFLLGEWDNYDRDRGTLKELDWVCKVIENGTCAEIRLLGEDETYECLTDILDNSGIEPEERARMLTDYGRA